MLVAEDARLRRIPEGILLSPDHLAFTSDILLDLGRSTIPYYLHGLSGPVEVGGGEFGSQVISAIEPTDEFSSFVVDSLARLGSFLAVDFRRVSLLDDASFAYFVDSRIEIGSGLTLGLAVPNSSPDASWWEVFLNGPAMQDDFYLVRYAFLHETGHLLGLEHPFDSSDGDVFLSSRPLMNAYPEETVMAYRDPLNSEWPIWYSPSDIDALVSAWGLREFDSTRILSSSKSSLLALLDQQPYVATFDGVGSSPPSEVGGELLHVQASDDHLSFSSSVPVLFELHVGSHWPSGYIARNVGSPGSSGTGQSLSLEGLLRNWASFSIDSSGSVGIKMPDGFNSSLFADDIFSAPTSVDRLTGLVGGKHSPMLQGVTDVFMSTAGGMSILDLTSHSLDVPPLVVWGASIGLSVFWGGSASDQFVGQGGDALIFGGEGSNSYSLGAGREVLQYRAGSRSRDLVYGFDWSIDVIELWSDFGASVDDPVIAFGDNILTMEWQSNVVDFVLDEGVAPGEISIEYRNIS